LGEYDITVKYLAQRHPLPYIRLVLPDFTGSFRVLPKHLPALETEIDFLIEVIFEGETFILHPDFQTRFDYTMPGRMLAYRVHIKHIHGKPVLSVVIWMTEEDYPGPGRNRLVETVAGQQQLIFEFLEVRLWEVDPEPVLAAGTVALLPLVPLMGPPNEEVLQRAVALAATVPDEEERADLYTGLSVLGGLRYSRDLIRAMIRSEQMSKSPIFEEIVHEGEVRGQRNAIVTFLAERFGPVPGEIIEALKSLEEEAELSRLLRATARCASLDEFAEQLPLAAAA
jgi:hypothetical protein